ncbi:uncharacterized protein LOC117642496 [Thrips palmi]|uniref:Uncharacterized protein LOC117642496 n=1 Tax=Thrips palmi TaxID=161013 RepID=A0A6P8YI18_THRPL|nr:uncharacterized protein LOC117642496 [Thrips palmi]
MGLMIADFEIAAMNVNRDFSPNIFRKGCLFHFNQSLWRKVVDDGLRSLYINAENEDHTVRRDVQRLMAVPFVPMDDVEEVFDMIVEEADDRVLNVATHLDNNYIRGNRTLRRAIPPLFPTNNVVEAYHSKFQKIMVIHHANVWKFLDELRSEEHDFHQILAQHQAACEQEV